MHLGVQTDLWWAVNCLLLANKESLLIPSTQEKGESSQEKEPQKRKKGLGWRTGARCSLLLAIEIHILLPYGFS